MNQHITESINQKLCTCNTLQTVIQNQQNQLVRRTMNISVKKGIVSNSILLLKRYLEVMNKHITESSNETMHV